MELCEHLKKRNPAPQQLHVNTSRGYYMLQLGQAGRTHPKEILCGVRELIL